MFEEMKTFEDRKKELIAEGKKTGTVTYEKLAEKLKGLDLDADSLDDLYNALSENHIKVISENPDDDETDITGTDAELLSKDLTINDPVRMYLKDHQLIIFTCTKREEKILNNLSIPYNLVEL